MHCDFDRTYLIAHMYTTTWIAQKKKEKIEKGRWANHIVIRPDAVVILNRDWRKWIQKLVGIVDS